MPFSSDPSILLQAQGIRLPDPIALAQQQIALADLAGRRDLQRYALAKQQRDDASAEALNRALPDVIRAGFSDDSIRAAPPEAQRALLAIQEQARKSAADARKNDVDARDKESQIAERQYKLAGGNAFELSQRKDLTPDDWNSFAQTAAGIGLRNIPAPADMSPDGLAQQFRRIANMSLTALDQMKESGNADARAITMRGQDMTAATAAAGQARQSVDAASGRGVQMQVAKMADARSRDANAATREAMGDNRINVQTQHLSKAVADNSLPQLMTSVTALDDTLKKYGDGDIPGVGRLSSMIPPGFLSAEGKAFRANLQAVSNDLLKLYSGGTVTLNEDERRQIEMMAGGNFTADDFRAAWPLIKGRVNAAIHNVHAGYPPEAVSAYEQRGGIKLRPIGSGGTGEKKAETADPPKVGQSLDGLPDPKTMAGVTLRAADGTRIKSDGTRWLIVR